MDPLILASSVPAVIVAWLFWTEFKGAGWQPVPQRAIKRALEIAKVGRTDVLYDLGAGDGRVITAAARAGARSIGIEIDPLRVLLCKMRLKIKGEKKAQVFLSDLFNYPLGDASIVFIYLRDWSNERLKRKFITELKPGTKIITYHWPLKGWRPVAQDKENDLWVYEIGERLASVV